MVCVAICMVMLSGCSSETAGEKIRRAMSDPDLSAPEAIQLLGEGHFNLESATVVETDDLVATELVVNGWDTSSMPAAGLGGVKMEEVAKRMRRVQFLGFLNGLSGFIANARTRKLGSLKVVLRIAVTAGDEPEWHPVYALQLEPEGFDDYQGLYEHLGETFGGDDLKKAAAEFDRTIKRMEKVWTVEFDRFDELTYERSE